MLILGIETSCDDTSAAILRDESVLANVVASQDDVHEQYGGVVPELAARRHLENVDPVITAAMDQAGVGFDDLDLVAVTRGPGLVGSLLVGVSAAQGLGLGAGVPVFGVNHLEGHVLSPLLEETLPLPFLALIVSGGHTALYLVRDVGDYAEVSATRDDSAGEAFDKGAKMMGLGYPGGRLIDEMAKKGNAAAYRFPRGRVRADPLAMSFSGLKTALWEFLRREGEGADLNDVCASFQEAIVDVLRDRTVRAVEALDVKGVAVAGGVSANSRLRTVIGETCGELGVPHAFPSMRLCTDNAAMIAFVARERSLRGLPGDPLDAVSRLPLGPRLTLS